jgi:uncharacterized protein with HEPN domain
MNKRDEVALRDMLREAQQAILFAKGHQREELETNPLLTYALERAVEIVGEAATKISDEIRQNHQEIPWRNIVGMRNILIHSYGEVNLDILWEVVTHNYPELVMLIKQILPSDE